MYSKFHVTPSTNTNPRKVGKLNKEYKDTKPEVNTSEYLRVII